MADKKTPSVSPAADLPLEEQIKDMPAEVIDGMNIVLDDDDELVENEDGSVDVILDQDEKRGKGGVPHNANLAEHLEEEEMQKIATDLLKKIERDKQSRTKRDEQYEEGLRRTGLGNDAPGGASFAGASRVVHPMIAEACVDFAAATMKELVPANGPAKTKINGKFTEHKFAVARRQQNCLNWQLTDQMSEYIEELEQLLTQLPLGGSQYMKFWYDATLKRNCCEFIPIDDLYLPYACTDFYTAPRITHVQRLTQSVFEERIESQFYREVAKEEPGQAPDPSKSGIAADKIEGRENEMDNIDGERIVYEVNTYAKLSIDGEEKYPYLISIDEHTGRIVSIYRNWEIDDAACTRLDWIVEYGFIAWRGAYKIGLPHLIGGLSAAATGALRALLDSAHFNNLPGFLRLKGARMGGQTKEINPAQGVEIEASAAIDDIRKVVAPLPYNQPSPVLMELIGWLTEAGKGVVTTAEEKIKDATGQMPVGTTLALIEQGAKVFSSIHARMHRAQKRSFQIIARLNKKHLSIGEQMTKLGEVLATRHDFAEPLGIVPISDPNIFSETQRYAQMQMVLSLAQGADPKTGAPTATAKLHNLYESVKRLYEIAKIPDYEKFLPEPEQPQELNAAAENTAVMMGKPVLAFPEQDHYAHIETHMRFLMDPIFGGDVAGNEMHPMLMDHVKQHLALLYAQLVFELTNKVLGTDVGDLLESDKRVTRGVDKVVAAAARVVHQRLQVVLQPLGQPMMQVLQKIAQNQPPMPMDPSQAVLAAEKMKQEGKQAETDKKLAAEREKAQREAQHKAAEMQKDAQESQVDDQLEGAKIAATREKTHIDASLRERELALKGEMEQAKLAQADMQHQDDIAFQSEEAERSRMAEAQAREADQSFQLATSREDREFQAGEKDKDRMLTAGNSERERQFKAAEGGAQRSHEAGQKDADRDLARRTKAADFVVKDHELKQQGRMQRESETRQLSAKDKSEQRNLKAQAQSQAKEHAHKEKLTKEQLKAKAAEAKAKPKPGGKK